MRLQYQLSGTRIDVSDFYLGRSNVRVLADVLRSYQSIEEVSASNCSIDDIDVQTLAHGIRRHKSIKILNLALNRIRDCGACALAELLVSVQTFEILYLDGNRIGARGRDALQNALPYTNARVYGVELDNAVPRRLPMSVFMEAENQKTPAGAFVRACGDRGVLRIVLSFLG